MFLRRNTGTYVLFGPCLDLSTGMSAAIGEAPSINADLKLIKGAGGTLVAPGAPGPAAVYQDGGMYRIYLQASDVNLSGDLWLVLRSSTNRRPVDNHHMVLEESVYDAIFGVTLANPTGVQSTFVNRLNQIWWRHFKRTSLRYGSGPFELKTYQNDNTSPATTQVLSDDGVTQIVNRAT